jgi:predicted AAA+ superfamily ATPase
MARVGKGLAIVVLGPRQVGKTTLMRTLFDPAEKKVKWFSGDDPDTREFLSNSTTTKLGALIGSFRFVVIDEAQRIENIGLTIKQIVDNFPAVQVMVTGSSSLEIANTINEPLTGRKYELHLYPLSFGEMAAYHGQLEERRLLHHRLIFGSYPAVVTHPGEEQELLQNLCGSSLYKDIFSHQQIKKPAILDKLLQALALQVGSETNRHELGQLLGIDPVTVERYLELLEKAYVIFRLPSLSRNKRNEIKNGRKIYFFDNGIRNAIIKNFNPPGLRQDIGALWENFCIVERMKSLAYSSVFVNRFFWRTHDQQELAYIEERAGSLNAVEFKWNPNKKRSVPRSFAEAYPQSTSKTVTPENYAEFVEGAD